jgi:hypothetical protein
MTDDYNSCGSLSYGKSTNIKAISDIIIARQTHRQARYSLN